MKFIYPAVFRKTEEGRFEGFFPDLEYCEVTADTLEDAVEKANEAARGWIEAELEEEEPAMPPVSDIEDLILKKNETARSICVTVRFHTGWDE